MNRIESLGQSRFIDADIIEFGRYNLNMFRKMRMPRNGIPSELTLCRVESGINNLAIADKMQEFVEAFHIELLDSSGGRDLGRDLSHI